MNIEKTIKNLTKNNMECIYLENKAAVIPYLNQFINDKDVVSVGGSMTLFECGVIEYLRNRDITFLDRYQEGLTKDEVMDIFRKSFSSDVYLTSTNAIIEGGYLYNVDGNGNRIAAMLFGPKKVIVIAGVNKIVEDLDKAINRVVTVAAPRNAKRLNHDTPCAKNESCELCDSKTICREYVLIKNPLPNRFIILLVNENLGY